jgi:uridine kinase
MTDREELLQIVGTMILARPTIHVLKVGIDGVDGAGKTMFGNELADILQPSGRSIIRASVDSFHHSRTTRYRLGRHSPDGYFFDSYNYAQLQAVLLDPLSQGGTGRYRTAIFDHRLDAPVSQPETQAVPGSILVFDGIFLHRPELRSYWDFSIFLDVDFGVSIPRGAYRDGGSADPQATENRRYVEGQQLYLRTCEPLQYATITINNTDLTKPYIVTTNT